MTFANKKLLFLFVKFQLFFSHLINQLNESIGVDSYLIPVLVQNNVKKYICELCLLGW